MPDENSNYHYDYRALDKLLTEDIPPERLWYNQDELLYMLVDYLQLSPTYPIQVGDRFYETRIIRDIFGNLKPWNHGDK